MERAAIHPTPRTLGANGENKVTGSARTAGLCLLYLIVLQIGLFSNG